MITKKQLVQYIYLCMTSPELRTTLLFLNINGLNLDKNLLSII